MHVLQQSAFSHNVHMSTDSAIHFQICTDNLAGQSVARLYARARDHERSTSTNNTMSAYEAPLQAERKLAF